MYKIWQNLSAKYYLSTASEIGRSEHVVVALFTKLDKRSQINQKRGTKYTVGPMYFMYF